MQRAAVGRERAIKQTAALDTVSTTIWIEQEPGSGGKESAESTVANLAGYVVRSERPSGDKTVRAEPLAVQVEAGNVRMLRGAWNKDFLDEIKLFPFSKYKDQTDAASGAFNKISIQAPVGAFVPPRIANQIQRG